MALRRGECSQESMARKKNIQNVLQNWFARTQSGLQENEK